MKNKVKPFTIRPITWSWLSWLERMREFDQLTAHDPDALSLLQKTSVWSEKTKRWLDGLSANEEQDVVELLRAEIHMLWEVVDPAAHAPSGYFPPEPGDAERLEFRERYYIAQPLLAMIEDLEFEGASDVRLLWSGLEEFGTEKGWLP